MTETKAGADRVVEEAKAILLTVDGAGKAAKAEVLDALLSELDRAREERDEARRLASEAVWQFKAMIKELCPGFDKWAIEDIIRALQDRYGSPVRQVEIALDRARAFLQREGEG